MHFAVQCIGIKADDDALARDLCEFGRPVTIAEQCDLTRCAMRAHRIVGGQQRQAQMLGRRLADRCRCRALSEHLIEAAATAHAAAPPHLGVMRGDADREDAREDVDRDGGVAVILGLRQRAVAGVSARKCRVLGDRVAEIAERALDRLR